MNNKLGRQSWLDAGLEQLAAKGPGGLRVMAVAKLLGVTKGSFYWHFRDQAEYLAALLEEWERSHTKQIIELVERTGGDPTAKLRYLLQVTIAADPRLTQAVRSWGQAEPMVGRAVKRVDKRRLTFVATLVEKLGWSHEDAATLARWSYCATIGHYSLQGPGLTEGQIELILSTIQCRPAGQRRK